MGSSGLELASSWGHHSDDAHPPHPSSAHHHHANARYGAGPPGYHAPSLTAADRQHSGGAYGGRRGPGNARSGASSGSGAGKSGQGQLSLAPPPPPPPPPPPGHPPGAQQQQHGAMQLAPGGAGALLGFPPGAVAGMQIMTFTQGPGGAGGGGPHVQLQLGQFHPFHTLAPHGLHHLLPPGAAAAAATLHGMQVRAPGLCVRRAGDLRCRPCSTGHCTCLRRAPPLHCG